MIGKVVNSRKLTSSVFYEQNSGNAATKTSVEHILTLINNSRGEFSPFVVHFMSPRRRLIIDSFGTTENGWKIGNQ